MCCYFVAFWFAKFKGKHEGQYKHEGLSPDNKEEIDLAGEVEEAGDTEDGFPVGGRRKYQTWEV